jgi:protein O-GlcNAc transferase
MSDGRWILAITMPAVALAACASTPRPRPPDRPDAPAPLAPPPAADSAAQARDSAARAAYWTAQDSLQAVELLRRGRHKLDTGQDSAAAPDFREALRLRPGLTEAYEGLAMVASREGRPAEALARLDTAAALGDTAPLVTNGRGRALAELRRCPEAVAVLEPFVRAHPEWTNSAPDLARCYLALQRESDAVAVMQEAVRREPDSGVLHYWLVNTLTASGRPDSALVHARWLTEHHPDDGFWWGILGRTLFLLNRLDEAQAAYERGIRLVPNLLDQLAPIDRSAWENLQQLRRRPPR